MITRPGGGLVGVADRAGAAVGRNRARARPPGRAAVARRGRAVARSRAAAGPEDAAPVGRSHRHRAGTPSRAALSGDRAGARRAARRAARRGVERVDARPVVLRIPHPRRRPDPGDAVPAAEPLRRRRPGAAGPVRRLPAGPPGRGAAQRHARAGPRGVPAPRAQRPRDRFPRAGRQRRPLAVRLRPAGKRQDGHRAEHPQPARRRRRRAARDRGRGPDHPRLRSGRARADRDAGERLADRSRSGRGSPLGALPAAARHRRRRAHAGRARAEPTCPSRGSTARRCRRWPTAACWSSTTSAGSGSGRATC